MIAKARQDVVARGALLEEYRAYMTLMARRSLDSMTLRRIDAEDVVQMTMMRAANAFSEFAGDSRQQFYRWLIKIHRNTILEELQKHRAAKRDLKKEQSVHPRGSEDAAVIYWLEPTDAEPTPSVRMMRHEQALMLAQEIYRLRPEQREAVRLRHLEGWAVSKIAETLGKSEQATAGLIKRGLEVLRKRLRV